MAKDDRIFRVTKPGYSGFKIKYATRTAVSAMFARVYYRYQGDSSNRPDILKVEATNAEATGGWTDVTDEFRNKPEPKCIWHRTYTGTRKPTIWGYKQEHVLNFYKSCTCWKLYKEKHPEYPTHDPLCGPKSTDPAQCACQVLKKLTE